MLLLTNVFSSSMVYWICKYNVVLMLHKCHLMYGLNQIPFIEVFVSYSITKSVLHNIYDFSVIFLDFLDALLRWQKPSRNSENKINKIEIWTILTGLWLLEVFKVFLSTSSHPTPSLIHVHARYLIFPPTISIFEPSVTTFLQPLDSYFYLYNIFSQETASI